MPPQKNRANTLQERFGFVDSDLKTPEHDAILTWLDQQVEHIAQSFYREEWNSEQIRGFQEKATRQIEKGRAAVQKEVENHTNPPNEFGLKEAKKKLAQIESWVYSDPPEKPPVKIEKKIWESTIHTLSQNKYVVGFVDMEAICKYPAIYLSDYEDRYDKLLLPFWHIDFDKQPLLFEIKTSIPSLGELIRQIRLYQEYKSGKYFVVSPDDRFADAIRNQGIGFIKCKAVNAQNKQMNMF